MAKKIGILGGTFNPVHIGHLVIAEGVLRGLGLDKVFFIPTNISPHKENGMVSPEHRLQMIKLALAGNESFEVLDIEIKRGGVSYTIDTVQELKKRYPDDELYLIVGSDLANSFSSWKDSGELQKMAKVVVAKRDNHPLKEKDSFIIVKIVQVDISSSALRDMLKKGRSIKGLVKDGVVSYIEKHNLYK